MTRGKHEVPVSWSFPWDCPHCRKQRYFIVSTSLGDRAAWARCPTCTSLMEVTDAHRTASAQDALAEIQSVADATRIRH